MPEPRGEEDPVNPWDCYSCGDPAGYVTVQTSNGPICLICLGKTLLGPIFGQLAHRAEQRDRNLEDEEVEAP